jgi:CxxC motif-containing protein (DUF1111 family)
MTRLLLGSPALFVACIFAVGTVFANPSTNEAVRGATLFVTAFRPEQGLGPLFNKTSCSGCHAQPSAGGTGPDGLASVTRIGRTTRAGFDSLMEAGGPVARTRSVAEFGFHCDLLPAFPVKANIVSVRNAPSLYGDGLINMIPDGEIVAGAVPKGNGVAGHANFITAPNGRAAVGRFGWKADTATLRQFVADAFRNELGITSPLAPKDLIPGAESLPHRCAGENQAIEDDGSMIDAVTAFVASLPAPRAVTAPNAVLFRLTACESCHVPSLKLADGQPIWLYSDLLLHDLGPDLDDGFVQGQAHGRDWRTAPLWGLGNRHRYLHDGRAATLQDAITAHGGEATEARKRFLALSSQDHDDLIAFLAGL